MGRKWLSIWLLLLWMLSSAAADTLIDGAKPRDITPRPLPLNEPEEGVSPTTGRYLSEIVPPPGAAGLVATGRYMPMMVQIDNSSGGVDAIAPWGVSYADMVYETPLHSNGTTRLSVIFSDIIPDSVGPIRSARVGHVWLRQEWNCGLMYYGGQTKLGSSIKTEFSKLKAKSGVVLFNGTDGGGKPWKQYYYRRKGLYSPHNAGANAAAISALIPESHTAYNHAFRFSVFRPMWGEKAKKVTIGWPGDYGSTLVYSEEKDGYERLMGASQIPWVDRDTGEEIIFQNVIVQFIDIRYNGSGDAPVPTLIGSGNADYFIAGQHFAGVWLRPSMEERTVFEDEEGQEITLLTGRTLIVQLPMAREVRFE